MTVSTQVADLKLSQPSYLATLSTSYTNSMRLVTLGGLQLTNTDFNRAKLLVLATYLALEGTRDRRHVAELFWPDAADHMKSLTVALAQARKAVPNLFVADTAKIQTELEVDALSFLDLLDTHKLDVALGLYKGPFLDGIHLHKWGVELEEWVYKTREFLAAKARRAYLQLAEKSAQQRQFEKAANLAETAYTLRAAPFPEPTELLEIHTFLLAGANARAHEVREEAEGFGLEPLDSAEEARQKLAPSTRVANLSKTTSVIPTRATSFIGRDLELTELANLLTRHQLVTLLAGGGMGKTRLALQLVHDQQADIEIHFVTLEALESSEQLGKKLAETLNLDMPNSEMGLRLVSEHIANRKMLMVLDNFEHLIEAADLLSSLLATCPNLKLLVTSRERLNLEEEYVFALEGLSYPKEENVKDAEHFDAINLFIQRIKRIHPKYKSNEADLKAILGICEYFEGLPLGLELAAAWAKVMPVVDIATEVKQSLEALSTRTRNVPERQRSLYATFDYSWQLLTPKEQALFSSLAIFRDGFTRQAANQVAAATIPLLSSLIDKSLLRVDPEGRYNFHPLVSQYAKEKLAENSSLFETIQDAHGHYFLSLLPARDSDADDESFKQILISIDADWENIRQMFDWSLKSLDEHILLRCVDAVEVCFERKGLSREGLDYLTQASQFLKDKQLDYPRLQGRLLVEAGWYYFRLERIDEARKLANEAIPILHTQNDHWESKGHNTLGCLAWEENDFLGALKYIKQALTIAQKHGDLISCAALQGNLGMTYQKLGDLKAAEKELQEALILSQQLEKVHRIIFCSYALGGIKRDLGALNESEIILKKALELSYQTNEVLFQPRLLLSLGETSIRRKKLDQAKDYLEEALRITKTMNSPQSEKEVIEQLHVVNQALTKTKSIQT